MRRATSAILASLLVISAARAARADELPRLDWNKPIRCLQRPDGEHVRVQCDPAKGTCLVAPARTSDGADLRRTGACSAGDARSYALLEQAGAKMIRAVAEAPPGFARSDAGRAYQVAFDLLDRVYLGGAWAPVFQKADPSVARPPGFPLGRGRVEAGFEASVLSPRGRSRHDFRVLEGAVSFTDLSVSGLVFAYDYQHVHTRPAFWVTTFFGAPRVHGVAVPFGFGFRTLRIEDRPPASRRALDLEIGELHLSWNPARSRDMYSQLRFEAGGDFGKRLADRTAGFDSGDWYVGPTGAVRSRLALGEGGLHYLFVDLDYSRPYLLGGGAAGRHAQRVTGTFAYEGVLVAINDQPISVRLAATGAAREDPAKETHSFELGATAGLRFSLWAPPRRFEPLPELEDP